MKRYLMIAMTSLALVAIVTPVYANDAHHPKAEAQKTYTAKGEVVAVDKAAGKVKLKHEAVPELDWPAMTMFFLVNDKSRLDALKVGDRVELEFVNINGGGPLIMQIKAVK